MIKYKRRGAETLKYICKIKKINCLLCMYPATTKVAEEINEDLGFHLKTLFSSLVTREYNQYSPKYVPSQKLIYLLNGDTKQANFAFYHNVQCEHKISWPHINIRVWLWKILHYTQFTRRNKLWLLNKIKTETF